MNSVLKWSASILGLVALVALIVFLIVKTVGSNNVTETAPAVPVEITQKIDSIVDKLGTMDTELSDLQNKPEQPAPAVPTELTQALTAALAGINTRLDELEKKPAAPPAVVAEPVVSRAVAPDASSGGPQFDIRMSIDEFEDSITTKNDDGYVTVARAEFARMFHGMSPPEQHHQFGTVSYVLMKGKAGPTFCHSEVGKSDPPPIKIPTGYREWRTDNTGRWMAVK